MRKYLWTDVLLKNIGTTNKADNGILSNLFASFLVNSRPYVASNFLHSYFEIPSIIPISNTVDTLTAVIFLTEPIGYLFSTHQSRLIPTVRQLFRHLAILKQLSLSSEIIAIIVLSES